ncbi:hypothetical protein HELRODRAFT_158654 [Helobdella robusta]|uniref:Uncharacterized protein n=1 Tax=Helobdella robusta TaxID=6412 RepID=T1EN33_HELRO|nr:hypothetical protein HELRODRAFT_158654 [Helobdella robusta]ESO12191.1 hypothetical protein HELRODRAFT_158654 [Helobdella robusta]
MWMNPLYVDDVIKLVRMWMVTLKKQGCGKMIQAGAEGVLQAMMLSIGALRFSDNHLELTSHPSDLHRDFFFRRINYGQNTHLNISIRVGLNNKAMLYVTLDRNNESYYACDAGCLDAPVHLRGLFNIRPLQSKAKTLKPSTR